MAINDKAESSGPPVDLLDLEVFRAYSIALRQATAPRAALIASLRADLAHLEATPPDTVAPRRRGRPPKSAAATATTAAPVAGRASAPTPARRSPTKARPTPARSTRRG